MNSRLLRKYTLKNYQFQTAKNLALNYIDWCEKVAESSVLTAVSIDGMPHGTDTSDPTSINAAMCEKEKAKIAIFDKCIEECSSDPNLQQAVKKAVTAQGITFNWLKLNGFVFYERDAYYLARAKFYYLFFHRN